MNIEEKAVLWLSLFSFISNKKAHKLIKEYGSAKNVFDNINNLKQMFKPEDFNKLTYSSDLSYLDNYINNCNNQNIGILTFVSDKYPKNLLNIDTPPLVLYYKGDVDLLNKKSIAIVGTRRVTKYGKDVTYKFSSELAKSGLVIVSGLVYGVDTVAHTACLDVKGKTIAVIGSGLNEIYPAENISLANKIIENGLIISEYKPNEKPQRYYFPMRNRIVAALSSGVLITEATLNSGSMHTKNFALDYGKDLFIVPGRITDIYSYGCNSVIKSLQGSMVLSVDDILSVYNLKSENNFKNVVQLSLDEELILNILGTDELHYEEILDKCKLDVKVLNTLLVKLEMKKIINKLPGNFYCK